MLFDGVDAGILVVIKVLWPMGWVHCNSRYPSFILKIWQTLTNMDLHKSATSDFGFAKKTKDRNFITIATHLLGACSQIYRALLILMAHWSVSSLSGLIISQPATCITRSEEQAYFWRPDTTSEYFLVDIAKKEEFYDFQNTENQAKRNSRTAF